MAVTEETDTMPQDGEQRPTVEGLQAELERAHETIASMERRWNRAVAGLHAEVDRRGYCSDADDAMEAFGFPRRGAVEQDFDVLVRIDASVRVRAYSADGAWSNVNQENVRAALDASESLGYAVVRAVAVI